MTDYKEIRHQLHEHPQTAGNEQFAHDMIVRHLQGLHPDKVYTNVGGYGVIAVWMAKDSSPSQGEVPEGRRGIAERCADVYRRVFDELNTDGTVRLFPHVLETIKALHDRGLQLAICSSRGRPTLEGFVKTFHLEHYVSMVVSANDVEHHKPHPEPVQKILAALGVAPGEAVVVGDASYDILMGRAAGCRTVGVTYGNQSAADLRAAGADHLIDDFADLLTIPLSSPYQLLTNSYQSRR